MENYRLTPKSVNNKNGLMTECSACKDKIKQKLCKFYIKSSRNGHTCMFLRFKEFCDCSPKKEV